MHEYDLIADWYASQRTDQTGVPEVTAQVSRVLKPGGLFLFTSGDEDGCMDGEPMNGVPFRYYSFTIEGYRDLLSTHRLTLEDTHTDAGGNLYYLSRRSA